MRRQQFIAFEELVQQTLLRTALTIFTYQLLPNHWHFVVRPDRKEDLSDFFQYVSGTHAKRFHAARGSSGEGHSVNLEQVSAELTPVLRGFANYFRMANCKGLFRELMSWIRRRLRAKQLALWKRVSRLHRRLRQLGYQGDFLKMRMRNWRTSRSPPAR